MGYDNGYLQTVQLEQSDLRIGGGAAVNAAAINQALLKASVNGGICSIVKPGTYRVLRSALSIPAGVRLFRGPYVRLIDSVTLVEISELEGIAISMEPRLLRPPIDFVPLTLIRGVADFNIAAPIEYGGFQWVIYWSSASAPVLARRPYPATTDYGTLNIQNEAWTKFDLQTIGTTLNFLDTAVDTGTEQITIPAHGLITGSGVFYSTNGGSVTGLSSGFSYWAIVVDANTIKLATSVANALAGTAINLGTTGAGGLRLRQNITTIGAASDSHLTLKLAFDSAGRIHVWANQHNGPASYAYCDVSDAGFATASNWHVLPFLVAAATESLATYWSPIMCPNGELLAEHRQGVAGNGVWYWEAWNATTKTWSRRCQLFDSGADAYSIYYSRHFDQNGRLHIFGSITNTGALTGSTNHDIIYCRTDDNGRTFQNSRGVTYALPITSTTAEVAQSIATGTYFQAGKNGFMHPDGTLYMTFFKSDGAATQFYLFYLIRPGMWSTPVKLTTWNYLYDTVASPVRNNRISSPQLLITNSGRILIIYRNSQQFKGSLRMMDVTDTSNIVDVPISKIDVYQQETPAIDDGLARSEDRVHLFQVPCLKEGTGSAEDFPAGAITASVWGAQIGVVMTLDLSQIEKILGRTCTMPGIETLSSGAFSSATIPSITNTVSPGDQLGGGIVASAVTHRNDLLLERAEVEVQVTSAGTFTARFQINRQLSTAFGVDYYNTTTTANFVTLTSAWIPLQSWPEADAAGGDYSIGVYGRMSAGAADVRQARIWLGRLAHVW